MQLLNKLLSTGLQNTLERTVRGASGKKTVKRIGENQIDIANIPEDFIPLVIAAALQSRDNIIWVNRAKQDLFKLKAKLEKWLDVFSDSPDNPDIGVLVYSLPFSDPYVSNQLDDRFFIEKNALVDRITTGGKTVLITTLSALNIRCEEPLEMVDQFLLLKNGEKIDRDRLIEDLVESGYKVEEYVEKPMEIAKRGGVVDLFPPGYDQPVRIELFGNEVSSLTTFDLETRASSGRIESCTIPSGTLFVDKRYSSYARRDNLKFLTELLPDADIFVSDIDGVMDDMGRLLDSFQKIYDLCEDPDMLPEPKKLFALNLYRSGFYNFPFLFDHIKREPVFLKKKNLQDLTPVDIELLVKRDRDIYLFTRNHRLKEKMAEQGLRFNHVNRNLPLSFENIHSDALFFTDRSFVYKKRVEARSLVKKDDINNAIEIGEYVVHEKHGIGVFDGFYKLKTGGNEQEYFKLKYSDGDILYVPTYDADVLTRYSAFQGNLPKLDKIGGKTWNLKNTRAKKSILVYAKELLDIYALRKSIQGIAYRGDAEMEEKLKHSFPYVETPDQERSIKEVLADLELDYPMERLVCGDVSFGKTEVAIRAAFRVVLDGKQVAVLCPTTILADQHYQTFQQRLAGFPLKIRKLSRMVPLKDRKEIIQEVNDGQVDILIGTHAIISKSVRFKRLGLFVVDEEQRFGVFQKEKIKQNREAVDVLILSATPIPRTLSLSFAGLADISTIATPPPGRMSIKNYIGQYSKSIIVSAVLTEIERGGAVFIVYNSIDKLYSFRKELSEWIDSISIGLIHAKMDAADIDRNLSEFIGGKHQVLLSTTIIENGIDITKVNTLIVIDADKFGLTQLYQLRGRIGRGKRQAYAYFLVRGSNLTEKAKLRLEGIREFSAVGSGFRLAEYDLKLRGAGALLGNKQHGHIEALGFEYYHNLLKRTIQELKGERKREWDGKINIHLNYSVDPLYIRNGTERLRFYSDIADASDFDEIDQVRERISSMYGKPTAETEKVFFVGKLKLLAKQVQASQMDLYPNRVIFQFSDIDLSVLVFPESFIADYQPEYKGDNRISFRFDTYQPFVQALQAILLSLIGKG